MKDLRGKVALISGGASGIGLAMARAFVKAGMKVAIADIDDESLSRASDEFIRPGINVLPVRLDVTDRYMWSAAADRIEAALGPVQLLCCNAGVAGSQESIEDIGIGSWQWSFDVNVNGTLYGVKTFLPRMQQTGKPAHIVITSSARAFEVEAGFGAGSATKAAQIAIAEALRHELDGTKIGVSVLCPGPVRTPFVANTSRYSRRVGVRVVVQSAYVDRLNAGIEPDAVARQALRAVRENRFWTFTGREGREAFEERAHEILAAIHESDRVRTGEEDSDIARA